MHIKNVQQFEALLSTRSPVPQVVVETGTFRGNSAILLSSAARVWHTVDINPEFTEFARKRCTRAGCSNIVFWTGDSRQMLPVILEAVKEPCMIFLDAHFGRVRRKLFDDEPDMVHGPVGADFPLMSELRCVRERPYADLVFVDDTVQFGKTYDFLRRVDKNGKLIDDDPQWESMSHELVEETLGRVVARQECYKGTAYWRKAVE